MKKLLDWYVQTSLILRIIIGMVLGALLGLSFPTMGGVPLLGTLFVGALKGVAPVLVFILVLNALANARLGMGGRFKTVTFLYLVGTFFAACTAVIGSFLFPVTIKLNLAGANSSSRWFGTDSGQSFWQYGCQSHCCSLSRQLCGYSFLGHSFWRLSEETCQARDLDADE